LISATGKVLSTKYMEVHGSKCWDWEKNYFLNLASSAVHFKCLKELFYFRVLTPYEAKSLVALLHSKDCDTLERVLVTVANSAAFSANQVRPISNITHKEGRGCGLVVIALAYSSEDPSSKLNG